MIANTSKLRLIAIRRTTSRNMGDQRVLDLPIIGWEGNPLRPVVVAALDPTDVLRIVDPDAKCWFSLDGVMFDTYARAAAEAWEPMPEQAVPALTVPGVGAAGTDLDNWGVGQQPERPRWRPGSTEGGVPRGHR
jgi:hypothetical protein